MRGRHYSRRDHAPIATAATTRMIEQVQQLYQVERAGAEEA